MKIIECPRDAMQGISTFIPTEKKIDYINQILKVGFHTVDFGSFVSPKSIPQLKDTAQVLSALDLSNTSSKLLSIIANIRGAKQACDFDEIDYLGFPLSVSEEFQKRNTNKKIDDALCVVEEIQNLCSKYNKQQVVYISMAFGNPYNEIWSPDLVVNLTDKLSNLDVNIIAVSDTIGCANINTIESLFTILNHEYANIDFGAHFHSNLDTCQEKIEAAYNNGCNRFDTTIKGYGGCPMANDDLVGNIPTEQVISFAQSKGINLKLKKDILEEILNDISLYFH